MTNPSNKQFNNKISYKFKEFFIKKNNGKLFKIFSYFLTNICMKYNIIIDNLWSSIYFKSEEDFKKTFFERHNCVINL